MARAFPFESHEMYSVKLSLVLQIPSEKVSPNPKKQLKKKSQKVFGAVGYVIYMIHTNMIHIYIYMYIYIYIYCPHYVTNKNLYILITLI